MIICHPLKLIFFKTCKTGGTSFECVLSNYCSPNCTITSKRVLEQNIIFYLNNKRYKFSNHTESPKVKKVIYDIWKDYKKIAIHRNPFEVLISMFYDATTFKHSSGFWNDEGPYTTNFVEYATTHVNQLDLNTSIAPIKDMDFIIRYEYIEEDIKKLNIDNFWEQYSITNIDRNIRPKESTVEKMYKGQKELVDLICERCQKEIEYFNYKIPLYN